MFFEVWIHQFAFGKVEEAVDLMNRWSAYAKTKGMKPGRILLPEWGNANRLYDVVEYESRAQRDKSWETLDETEKGFVKEFRESGVFLPSQTEHYFFTEAK